MDTQNQYGTLAIQKSCVALLKSFDYVATQNNIIYSLAYGSLLGAIRHKGFIPWDDDVDIIVDRANYHRIIETICSSDVLKIDRKQPDCLWIDRIRFKRPSLGNENATIDIFIFDNSPNGKVGYILKLYSIYFLQGMMKYNLSLKKGNLLMKCCALLTYIIGFPFSYNRKYDWYNRLSQICNNRQTENIECYNSVFEDIPIKFPRRVFEKLELWQFEDLQLPVMSDYDTYLKIQYGDYMTPPKVEDRIPLHIHL